MSSYYKMSRPEIVDFVPNNIKSVLDVGCSEGLFGNEVKKKCKCTVWGIEPEKEASEKASKILDKVFNDTFDNAIKKIESKFDLICFNDVLEHMQDPYNALNECQNLLNSGGTIIASLPNFLHYQEFLDILLKKDFKYTDAGIMDKTHLRFFTKKSIIRMFVESGFKIIEIKGIDPTPSKKMSIISLISFGYLSEMRYPQFVIQAKL